MREIASGGLAFPESPRWHDGRLLFSDQFGGHVYEVDGSGRRRALCAVPGGPAGLGWDDRSRLLIASMQDRRLLRWAEGRLEQVADLSELAPGGLNDMVTDASGRAYVGSIDVDESGATRPTSLIRVDPDGSATVMDGQLTLPNGAVLTDDGRTLVVAETFGARLSAFDVGADGSLTGQRVWAQFAPERFGDAATAHGSGRCLPDGISLDASGAIWIADSGGGPVIRVAEGGEILDELELDDELTAWAVTLGGEDGRTLFACLAPSLQLGPPAEVRGGRVVACQVDVPAA